MGSQGENAINNGNNTNLSYEALFISITKPHCVLHRNITIEQKPVFHSFKQEMSHNAPGICGICLETYSLNQELKTPNNLHCSYSLEHYSRI